MSRVRCKGPKARPTGRQYQPRLSAQKVNQRTPSALVKFIFSPGQVVHLGPYAVGQHPCGGIQGVPHCVWQLSEEWEMAAGSVLQVWKVVVLGQLQQGP